MDDWRKPATGVPHRWWDWNSPLGDFNGEWTERASDYPEATVRGIVLLWCDDTIVPPIGQYASVGAPAGDGLAVWSAVGREFDVEQWAYGGRVVSYEEAARLELRHRLATFVSSPSESHLVLLVNHARFLTACDIRSELASRVVVTSAVLSESGLSGASHCRQLCEQLLRRNGGDTSEST
jgi:hypothetical protein